MAVSLLAEIAGLHVKTELAMRLTFNRGLYLQWIVTWPIRRQRLFLDALEDI